MNRFHYPQTAGYIHNTQIDSHIYRQCQFVFGFFHDVIADRVFGVNNCVGDVIITFRSRVIQSGLQKKRSSQLNLSFDACQELRFYISYIKSKFLMRIMPVDS